jgi:hypothetical protein
LDVVCHNGEGDVRRRGSGSFFFGKSEFVDF